MGLRFRKSINLGGGARVNFSKSGVGYSFGTKGYRVTKTAKGKTRTTISIPNTGLSYVTESSAKKRKVANKSKTKLTAFKDVEVKRKKEEEGLKILAWISKILFAPMIILGLFVSLVEPTTGLTSVAIGVIEFLYSRNYFKKSKIKEDN